LSILPNKAIQALTANPEFRFGVSFPGDWFMREALASLLGLLFLGVFGSNSFAGENPVSTALIASIDRHIGHARGWLAAGDFKSLAQNAGGLELLAAVLSTQSNEAVWQEGSASLIAAARAVRSAAEAEDPAAAESALANLGAASAVMAKLAPSGQPLPPAKANLRSLMLLMDGIRGDTKIALVTGNAENAKNQAYVLSELGRVVSNLRSGDRWAVLSKEFTTASLTAARSPAADAAELRPLLKAVSQRCDACHDSR
jgi:hypothetical protein